MGQHSDTEIKNAQMQVPTRKAKYGRMFLILAI